VEVLLNRFNEVCPGAEAEDTWIWERIGSE